MERLDILNRAIFEAKERVEDCASLSEDRLAELRKAKLGDEYAVVMALALDWTPAAPAKGGQA